MRPGAWSKRIVPILLMSNGCVLGITCNKPIRVSSPIPFKSELQLVSWRIRYLNGEILRRCKVCFGFCSMFLFFTSFILKLVMVLVSVLLPFPSCLHAIGSHVHCVMFLLVCSFHVTHSVCYK